MTDDHIAQQVYHFGPWVFDVDQALEIIRQSPRQPRKIDAQQWARSLGVARSQQENREAGKIPILVGDVDEEYARIADLTEPVLLATLQYGDGEESYLLIDGTHRLRGAAIHGVPTLPAHILTVEESEKIRSGPNRRRRR